MYRAPLANPYPDEPPPWQSPALPARIPRKRRRFPWYLIRLLIILAIWLSVAATLTILWCARDLPRPEDALDAVRKPSLVLQDQSGQTIATYGDVVGEPLRLPDLPPYMAAAAISVEDRRFYTHGGLDWWGMARALSVNIARGHLVQGGSTITQQVAKTLFLTNARTIRRKIQEVLLTLWLEKHFTKQQILEIWLNRVYLGSGVWGIDAAAHVYFGVSARHLQLWQAAVIAGLPRAPSRFNPRTDPAAAAARGKEVLAAMVATAAITQAQATDAAARMHFATIAQGGGWFADWAATQAEPLVPNGQDAVIRTTLDAPLQQAVQTKLAALLDGPGVKAGATQGAVVVLDAATGAVRALVGGSTYGPGAYNRATLARRQPGSAFKAFVWLNALEHGLHPDDTVLDAPLRIGTWSPQDFEPGWRGEVTLQDALAQSLNTASVRLLLQSGGAPAVIATAHRLGITAKLPDVPAIALGTGEVGLLEMTSAYATFFNGGRRIAPTALVAATIDHQPITIPELESPQVTTPENAAAMAQMMQAVVTTGTARAAAVAGHLVAGKTGTTQDNRDAWFIGHIDGRIIGIWIGNDDATPMRGVMGGGLPALLFHQIAAAQSHIARPG